MAVLKGPEHFAPTGGAGERHVAACVNPQEGVESALIAMARGIGAYATSTSWPDGYLTPNLGAMLDGFIGLLSGRRGGRLGSGHGPDDLGKELAACSAWITCK